MLRLGLVGAGRWGRSFIRTLGAARDARLAGLASRNPQSAALVPAGCRITADWRELLDPAVVDGVIIATPPRLHAQMACAAIEAGLPVLVEKPLTLDVAEARSIRDLAAARGALVMVGHTHLFHPAYRALKAMQPGYGPVREIRAEAGNHGPFRPDVPVLWDWGAHDVAMCLDLLGAMPGDVDAAVLERRELEEGIAETVRIRLSFAQGTVAELRMSNQAPRRRRFEVACERATLAYDDLAAAKLVVTERGASRPVEIAPDLPLAVEVAEFAAAIAAGSRDASQLDLGVRVVETLAACSAAALGPSARR